jgi:hypothetical protein
MKSFLTVVLVLKLAHKGFRAVVQFMAFAPG